MTMRRAEILSALEAVGRQPDEMIDLAEAALLLGALDYPETDLAPYRRHLAALAANLADTAAQEHETLDGRVAALTQVLAEQHGYAGDRRTYDDLQNANLVRVIDRRKGQGTFVHDGAPGLWLLQSSEGFFQDEVDRAGHAVTSRTIRAERGELPVWACEALDLPAGSSGATLERLRSVDGAVALYVVNHLPEALADAAMTIANSNESLYRRLYEHAGILPHGGRRTLEAVSAEDWLAALLELEPGAPVAFIESVGWDAQLRPFDTYRAWLRTDRTRIDVQVSGTAPASAH